LAARGFEYEIKAQGVSLTATSFTGACKDVESLIIRLGGMIVATNIFQILERNGKVYRGLFLYGRAIAHVPTPREPNVPWHFLYNLALKHLTVKPTSEKPVKDWSELLDLARDVGASVDVEEYYGFGLMNISPYLVDRVMLDNTLYDELFSFQQWSAEGAQQLFEWWIDALVEARCDFPLATAQEWRAMAKSLLGRAAASEPVATHVSFLWSLAISSDVFVRLLAALAVPSSMINRDYKTPVDTKSRDAPFFPIVDVGRDLYVIPPRGIAARALYERLYTLMRDAIDPRLETKLGNALERLTARILENAGNKPSVVAGKYSHPTKRFQRELDLAVETKKPRHFP
jgi:hypothetical protein